MNIVELSEKLEDKGFVVEAKVMKKSSRNLLGEECKAEYVGRVVYFKEKDPENQVRLYLTSRGLEQYGIFSKDPVSVCFDSEENCSSALKKALIDYFTVNVVRHFNTTVERIKLGTEHDY